MFKLDGIWLGSIFLKDEGGYGIVLRSLDHYKTRLRTVHASPELANAAMFSQIVQQEAQKTYPAVQALISETLLFLTDPARAGVLEDGLSLFLKALESYGADLDKAKNSEHEYYRKIIDLSRVPRDEERAIRDAIFRISSYAKGGKDVNERARRQIQ